MSSEVAISVQGVGKTYEVYAKPAHRMLQMVLGNTHQMYKSFPALSGINFVVHRGETIGVLGRNGSGKSTLLQIIAGTLTPTSGSVEVRGRLRALLELGAGFNPDFTGRENAYLNGSIHGISKDAMDAKMPEIEQFADIGEFIDQPVKTYSSGMFARLAFSVALSMDPEILIVDEILSVGDVFFQAKCIRRLDEFRAAGGTVFFVTHDTYAVERVCNRGIVLDAGKKVFEGSASEAVNAYYRLNRGEQAGIMESVKTPSAINADAEAEAELLSPDATPVSLRRDQVVTNGAAQIMDLYILDDHGRSRDSFIVGEWVTFRMNVKFNADVPYYDFGVGLRDQMGTLLAGSHSMYADATRSGAKAGETVNLTCRLKLDVEPKEYLLVAGISQHESRDAYAEIYGVYDCARLVVTGRRQFWGQFGAHSVVPTGERA